MNQCRCGHEWSLHSTTGQCLALIAASRLMRCGCPEYQRAEVEKEKTQ